MKILVTGGSGYIGSHTCIELINAGFEVVVIDNLSNSSHESIARVEKIVEQPVPFYDLDVCDTVKLRDIFQTHKIDAVIHFAGLKAVGESVAKPLSYYQNNLESTLSLLEVMEEHAVKKIVFSSSATVYGNPKFVPINEDFPLSATNPYGQTKLMIEQILKDLSNSQNDWNITSLRYFNPIGAHSSGTIGEDPNGIPNNLLPYISQVAAGKLKELAVYGNDYDTIDGTGVRDYIHVVDLALAHVAAVKHLTHPNEYKAYNIGTGQGTSVLELLTIFSNISKKDIPYKIVDRRPGDIASCYANVQLAKNELQWGATLTIKDGCESTWKWQSHNPLGYN